MDDVHTILSKISEFISRKSQMIDGERNVIE